MGLLSALLAACAGSPAAAATSWSRESQVVHDLDSIVRVTLPKSLLAVPDRTTREADHIAFHFRKPYKSHMNGTSSYAEALNIVLFAPDFPRTRFDSVLADGGPMLYDVAFGRAPGLGTPTSGTPDANNVDEGLRWLVREATYERSPVSEPSWYLRVDDRAKGVMIAWRGFKSQYTLDAARANMRQLMRGLEVSPTLAASFVPRRSWGSADWQSAYARNLATITALMQEEGFQSANIGVLSAKGAFRLLVDDERPQRLHVIHEIAGLALPDGPFRLTEPVTAYRFYQNRWNQDNQGGDGVQLPPVGAQALARAFPDTGKVYFYRIRAIDLWTVYGDGELAALVRRTMKETAADAVRFRRDGFIAGDAEP